MRILVISTPSVLAGLLSCVSLQILLEKLKYAYSVHSGRSLIVRDHQHVMSILGAV